MGYELQSSGFNSNLSTTCVLVPIVTCCGYVWAWFKNLALWPMTWLFSSGGRHPKAVSVSSNLGPTKQHGEHRTKINRKCNFYNSNICDRNFKVVFLLNELFFLSTNGKMKGLLLAWHRALWQKEKKTRIFAMVNLHYNWCTHTARKLYYSWTV